MLEASRSPGVRRTAVLYALKRGLFAEPEGYLAGSLVTVTATSLSLVAAPHASLAHLMVIYLLGAVLIATRYGVSASSFTIAASALCFDYFNIPPIFAFALPDTHSVLTLGGMLLTAVVVCSLIQHLRFQRTAARASEARTLELCAMSLDLSEAEHAEEVSRIAERHLVRLYGADARVTVRDSTGRLPLARLSPEDRAAVEHALRERAPVVRETDGSVRGYQCIASGAEPLGVIVVPLSAERTAQPREQLVLLVASADRIAVAVDRLVLGNAARRAQVEAEAERLRNELLSSMSHDLKTPLAAILTAGTLLLNRDFSSETVRRELTETIVGETERLNRLVTNLLSVTRLESGSVLLNQTPEALDELVIDVLSRLAGRLEGRQVAVDVADALPLVSMDAVLVDQVLVNLVENVLRHTPAGSPLDVRVQTAEEGVSVEIADRGPGIDEDECEKVFQKFYRGSRAKRRDGGSGLGLTICRAVARAHGGRIAIRPRAGGGTSVELVLPASSIDDASGPRASRLPLEVPA
jgi:two-component system sensor histidine kinase KdpD